MTRVLKGQALGLQDLWLPLLACVVLTVLALWGVAGLLKRAVRT